MVAIDLNGTIRTFSKIPKTWGNVLNYDKLTERHSEDGFKPVTQPEFDSETQRKGAIYFDAENDVFTYEVVEKTETELQQEKVQSQQIEKEKIVKKKLETQVEQEMNALPDNEKYKAKKFYPYWRPEEKYKADQIINTFDEQLYKCIQDHTSQSDWHPSQVPALFTPIPLPGTIGAWIQPTGSHDAYAKDAQVTHNGLTWASEVDGNVWEPPTQWKEVK